MLKYLFLIAFIVSQSLVWGQNERHIKQFFKDFSEKKRASYFLKIPDAERNYWLKRYEKQVGIDTLSGQSLGDIEKSIYFIDLNHDKFPDIVDESAAGVSPIDIYLGQKDSFQFILTEDLSRLKELNFVKDTVEIVLYSPPYVDCDYGEIVYTFHNNSTQLDHKRYRRCCTMAASKYFKHPLSIQTISMRAPIRENPKIAAGDCLFEDDEEGGEYNSLDNNIFKRFSQYSKGFAWGETIDTNGQKWWLVEILDADNIDGKEFIVGWMNPNDLEILK